MFEPGEELRLEDEAGSIERVAREPYQLGPAKAEAAYVLHLGDEGLARDVVGETHRPRSIDDLADDLDLGEVLPDELQHQQLVEVRVEQRADDRVQTPVMVVGPLGEVHIHVGIVACGGSCDKCEQVATQGMTSWLDKKLCGCAVYLFF